MIFRSKNWKRKFCFFNNTSYAFLCCNAFLERRLIDSEGLFYRGVVIHERVPKSGYSENKESWPNILILCGGEGGWNYFIP